MTIKIAKINRIFLLHVNTPKLELLREINYTSSSQTPQQPYATGNEKHQNKIHHRNKSFEVPWY